MSYKNAVPTERSRNGNSDVQQFLTPKYEDKFLVDRRKLELLLMGAIDHADYAEEFFNSVMQETNTVIDWPRRLKIGAKTRKDPYVRISGQPCDVKKAKEKVLSQLDPKGSHTIMKLDICYTDHSHIIGKGGQTIQRVKEDTGCHIHFPDSNRNNPNEKSNQVSIAGEIEGVEKARQRLRMLTPVKFSFELPAVCPAHVSPHPVSQIVGMVQEKYNVHVIFKKGPRLFSNVILVKGSEAELVKAETATRVLMKQLCDSAEDEVPAQMTVEISPHHHPIVMGVNSCNIKTIMVQTSTVIIFPDAEDPNLPPIKKSTVIISGNIHNVYLAKQRLVGSLPLVLRFDVWEEKHLGIERCNKIMQLLDVKISARFKPKCGTYSVCIKGLERNAGNLYKARQLLLNSNEPVVKADIPPSYFPQETLLKSAGMVLPKVFKEDMQSSSSSSVLDSIFNLSPGSSAETSSSNRNSHDLKITPVINEDLITGAMALDCQSALSEPDDSKNSSFGSGLLHLVQNKSSLSDYCSKEDNSPVSSNTSCLSSPTRRMLHSSQSIFSQGLESGYGENCESEPSRPVSGISMIESVQQGGKQRNELSKKNFSDYDNIKPLAVKAMQDQPDASKLRVPNTQWSGFGFSHSMPGSVMKSFSMQSHLESAQTCSGSVWGDQLFFPLEYKICNAPMQLPLPSKTMDAEFGRAQVKGNITDVVSLLESIGLERYSYVFTSQELDMETFMTLDDNDLRELGLSTHTGRQKILRTISELRKMYHFNGDSASGAESKPGTSTQWGQVFGGICEHGGKFDDFTVYNSSLPVAYLFDPSTPKSH